MGLLTEIGVWLLVGVVVSAVGPILLAIVLPPYWADKLSDAAWSLVMSALGRGLIIFRETTRKPILKRYGENAYLSSLTVRLNGETKHYFDFMNLLGSFKGRPLGMVPEEGYAVINPRLAEIAELLQEAHASDRGVIEQTESVQRAGEELERTQHYIRGYIPFIQQSRAVDIGAATRVLSGDATAGIVELIKRWTETGQSGFDSYRGTVDYFIWLTSLGVGFGLMWLASRTADTGASIPTNPFPAMLGVLPL